MASYVAAAGVALCLALLLGNVIFGEFHEERQVYIVYMGKIAEGADESLLRSYHQKILQELVVDESRSVRRSYTRTFNGFAATLTSEERDRLAGHEHVVSIFPSKKLKLQTTRSWDFIGFPTSVERSMIVETDTVVCVLDSGIWPESESFNDEGFGPAPEKWKGACAGGANFTCNNKLIGARHYGFDSARDTTGHGSHTASTAAGNNVGASFYGIARGIARGAVPSARIAAYKVCGLFCHSEALLAGFDDAIADGCDLISISVSPNKPEKLTEDTIVIGALHATQRGVLVVQSAGNGGPTRRSVTSLAPWIFSVAASSTDRAIVNQVSIGDGANTFKGKSVDSFSLNNSLPLVYGVDAASSNCSQIAAEHCIECLDPVLVKGKSVVCNTYSGMYAAAEAGALGAVVLNDFTPDGATVEPIAASALAEEDFHRFRSILGSTKSPKVDILTSQEINNTDAPKVASFSSRGPNRMLPDILKPDITAPGIEILAAFSPVASPTEQRDVDRRSVTYSILSGTSMSCPHVTGASAYVRSFHPNWSPAAIKSALMTTAWRMDQGTMDELAEFSYGAGHIDPVKAVDPGLVYETTIDEYVGLMCSKLKNDSDKISKIFGIKTNCTTENIITKNLNYPTMTAFVVNNSSGVAVTFSETFRRAVKNVGDQNSTYKVTTSKSPDYRISVKPETLMFGAINQTKSFEVSISGKINQKSMVTAWLEWSDGLRIVRSPIIVYTRMIRHVFNR